MPYATHIPQLLIAVNKAWPEDNQDWPDWQHICRPNIADLQQHEWWPHVIRDGLTTTKGESLQSLLKKRKVEESVEEPTEGALAVDGMEVEEIADADARRREIVEGKRKAKDNDHTCSSEDIECGHSRQRRKIHDLCASTATLAPSTISNSQEEETKLDIKFSKLCSECTKNIECHQMKNATTCQACKKSKHQCSHAMQPKGCTTSHACSCAISRPPGDSKAKDATPLMTQPRLGSPPLVTTRGHHQSHPPVSKGKGCKSHKLLLDYHHWHIPQVLKSSLSSPSQLSRSSVLTLHSALKNLWLVHLACGTFPLQAQTSPQQPQLQCQGVLTLLPGCPWSPRMNLTWGGQSCRSFRRPLCHCSTGTSTPGSTGRHRHAEAGGECTAGLHWSPQGGTPMGNQHSEKWGMWTSGGYESYQEHSAGQYKHTHAMH